MNIDNSSSLYAITIIISAWYEKINKSYENDPKLTTILDEKSLNISSWPEFTLTDGVLRYKNMVIIGINGELKRRLFDVAYDFCVSRHTGIQNWYKRLKSSFLLTINEGTS